jgi:hypothetical protein
VEDTNLDPYILVFGNNGKIKVNNQTSAALLPGMELTVSKWGVEMTPDLSNTSRGAEKFLAAHENKEERDISQNGGCSEVCECSALRYCCFVSCIPAIEGLIRTGHATWLT